MAAFKLCPTDVTKVTELKSLIDTERVSEGVAPPEAPCPEAT